MREYAGGLGKIDWEDFARDAGYPGERQMLEEMYSGKGLSMSEIGERVGYSKWVVLYHLRKHGIARRPWGGVNSLRGQIWRLGHLDQRVVLHAPQEVAAKAAQVSRTVIFQYRRWIKTNSEWAEVYASKEKVEHDRAEQKRVYRIFRERYG